MEFEVQYPYSDPQHGSYHPLSSHSVAKQPSDIYFPLFDEEGFGIVPSQKLCTSKCAGACYPPSSDSSISSNLSHSTSTYIIHPRRKRAGPIRIMQPSTRNIKNVSPSVQARAAHIHAHPRPDVLSPSSSKPVYPMQHIIVKPKIDPNNGSFHIFDASPCCLAPTMGK